MMRILNVFIERHARAPSPDALEALREVYVKRGVDAAVERARV